MMIFVWNTFILVSLFAFLYRAGIKARTCDGHTEIFTESTTIGRDSDALFVCIFKSVSSNDFVHSSKQKQKRRIKSKFTKKKTKFPVYPNMPMKI